MTIASVSTVMILIFFFGFSLLFFFNFQRLRATLASEIEMHAYLKGYVTQEQGLSLAHHVESIAHVASVEFVSKEETLKKLQEDIKQEVELSGIMTNPLPAYLIIRVNDPESIPAVAGEIGKLSGVDQVNYLQRIIPQFLSLFRIAQHVLLGLVIFVLICALLIIHNTIRLGVFSRKNEIEIMKLVGASHGFITWPFVLEGAFYGLLGAVLAILFLEPTYHAISGKVAQFFPLWPLVGGFQIWALLVCLIGIGISVGGSGSYLSVKKYLHY